MLMDVAPVLLVGIFIGYGIRDAKAESDEYKQFKKDRAAFKKLAAEVRKPD